jgi:hypothetical protein
MTRDDVTTLQVALDQYISDLSVQTNDAIRELERARALRDRAQAAIDSTQHIRDEDLVPDVIRPGDLLRVSTAIIQDWIDLAGGASVAVVVKHITVDSDGTKTVVVGAATPVP